MSPGSDAAGNVTLTPGEAVALGEYIRDLQHWIELAAACLGDPAKAFEAPAVVEVGTNLGFVSPDLMVEAAYLNNRPAVMMADCGTANAYYLASLDAVVICREMEAAVTKAGYPLAIRAILAHELGHALVHELDLPITGSPEAAADEFASVALPLLSKALGDPAYAKAVEDIGLYWFGRAVPEVPFDDHPSDFRRGTDALCMFVGSTDPDANPTCAGVYRSALNHWARLIERFGR